jgi:ribosome-binding protein aMBF1 (putative translation factor)
MADLNKGRTDDHGNREFVIETTGGPKKYFNKRRRRNPLFKPPRIQSGRKVSDEWYTTLVEELRQARLAAKLTQRQLGKLIGSNQAAISRFELGKINITADFLSRLAKALKLKLTIDVSNT